MTKNRGKIKVGAVYIYPEMKAINESKQEMDEKPGVGEKRSIHVSSRLQTRKCMRKRNQAELEQMMTHTPFPRSENCCLEPINSYLRLPAPVKQKLKLTALTLLEQFQSRSYIQDCNCVHDGSRSFDQQCMLRIAHAKWTRNGDRQIYCGSKKPESSND